MIRWILVLSVFLLSCIARAQDVADLVQPEGATLSSKVPTRQALFDGIALPKTATANKHIVVAANPYASQAGLDILNNGGNAIDAMVTVQFVLGLVEPQSSGIGGGAFALFYDASKERIHSFDGRETAPATATEDLFLDKKGNTLAFFEAVIGGRSVGTPGVPLLLWELHQRFGALSWPTLLRPAIELAEKGFVVGPRMAGALIRDKDRLTRDAVASAYFYPNGQALEAGQRLVNPAYAVTLKRLSEKGGQYFYHPDFAQDIVDKVQGHQNPGRLSLSDFKSYKIVERPSVCAGFVAYEVCSMGPPSSGAHAVNQILSTYEQVNCNHQLPPESPMAWHVISEASRLAFADRGQYLADPDYYPVPQGLLEPSYLLKRATLIDLNAKLESVAPGIPRGSRTATFTPDLTLSQRSTTHFVIADKLGNVLSMTSSIENGFGSRLMTQGFLLNNQLTDFSFSGTKDGHLVANRVEPGKRPRSSMSPVIVLKDGRPELALGSPGGSRIINYVANTLIRVLAWNTPLDDAINRPHIVNRFGPLDIEKGGDSDSLIKALRTKGYQPNIRDLNSGLHGIHFHSGQWFGAADKRREGAVAAK